MSAFQLFLWSAGSIGTLRYLLENGGDPYAPSTHERVPLHLAVAAERWDAVDLLLSLPRIDVKARDVFLAARLYTI